MFILFLLFFSSLHFKNFLSKHALMLLDFLFFGKKASICSFSINHFSLRRFELFSPKGQAFIDSKKNTTTTGFKKAFFRSWQKPIFIFVIERNFISKLTHLSYVFCERRGELLLNMVNYFKAFLNFLKPVFNFSKKASYFLIDSLSANFLKVSSIFIRLKKEV